MSGAAAGVSAGGSILGGISKYQQAKAQAKQYKTEAGQLRNQANDVNASAQMDAREENSKARQAESTSLANAAASGASANSVSAVNNRADIAQQGELNSLTTIWNGEQQANQLKNQASSLDAQAKATKKAGKMALMSSILGGGSSLMSNYG